MKGVPSRGTILRIMSQKSNMIGQGVVRWNGLEDSSAGPTIYMRMKKGDNLPRRLGLGLGLGLGRIQETKQSNIPL